MQWLDHDMSNKSAWFSLSRAFYSKRTIDRVHKLQISQIDISTKITLWSVKPIKSLYVQIFFHWLLKFDVSRIKLQLDLMHIGFSYLMVNPKTCQTQHLWKKTSNYTYSRGNPSIFLLHDITNKRKNNYYSNQLATTIVHSGWNTNSLNSPWGDSAVVWWNH